MARKPTPAPAPSEPAALANPQAHLLSLLQPKKKKGREKKGNKKGRGDGSNTAGSSHDGALNDLSAVTPPFFPSGGPVGMGSAAAPAFVPGGHGGGGGGQGGGRDSQVGQKGQSQSQGARIPHQVTLFLLPRCLDSYFQGALILPRHPTIAVLGPRANALVGCLHFPRATTLTTVTSSAETVTATSGPPSSRWRTTLSWTIAACSDPLRNAPASPGRTRLMRHSTSRKASRPNWPTSRTWRPRSRRRRGGSFVLRLGLNGSVVGRKAEVPPWLRCLIQLRLRSCTRACAPLGASRPSQCADRGDGGWVTVL